MSTTTVADLRALADQRAGALTASQAPVSAAQWESFDATLHQLLVTIDEATSHSSSPAATDVGRESLSRRAALPDYPRPLRPPLGKTTYTLTEAAQLLDVAPRTITARVRDGLLTGHREGQVLRIDAECLHPHAHVPLANPADAHPLARLTVTLGALNDLLASDIRRRISVPSPGFDEPTGATLAAHVLSVASVAARHALQYGPIADAMRPLLVAQYADRRYDALSRRDNVAYLPMVAATVPTHPPTTPVERLEAAVNAWAAAARTDLTLTVPSIDVIRNVTNQAAHTHAVTAAVLTALDSAHRPFDHAAGRTGRGPIEGAVGPTFRTSRA